MNNTIYKDELVKTKIYTTYAPDTDITFIIEDVYMEDEFGNIDYISTEVKGFYFGTPNDEDTQEFIGKLKAEF